MNIKKIILIQTCYYTVIKKHFFGITSWGYTSPHTNKKKKITIIRNMDIEIIKGHFL